ncbi:thioesterase family protein [Aureibaculum sp. 2210JD6-5]|uniref:acyl-CoA thioesterase n=1 Tax=Aureibaculum sp. 2210JD6-5 TaxID=3103957 RepID=UPI002AAE2AD3|nr:thioesterase family protein [Aureibaculum sp. 2210JD6-5]MDY7393739.1 thioesterase family protein [Aureibaculum sp. 2210JD6-5]
MLNHEINIRVRYGETDQMKYVYYGNYAQYFEMGRVEWLRNLGMSYKKMEELGIMLPVINMNINYLKPAKYDDLLTLKTILLKEPGFKIEFAYELYNEANELLTKATTALVFIDIERNRPTKAPDYILEKLKGCF